MTTEAVPTSVEELLELYALHGALRYGEDVTQIQHALQCAALARDGGASDELVAAALLHDVGHLVAGAHGPRWRDDVDDDRHEALGAKVLAVVLGTEVAAPVALHVTAKRWRCAVEPGYHDALSSTSKATLVAQGGPLDEAARARFEAHPAFDRTVALRAWDDEAKDPSAEPGTMRDYEPLLARLARRHASSDD
ncbi:MAG TPA: HD domain-containing protein [Acidimicrobiales bacterium]|nr:HD domain-containing protein [Acidimicrobiales bacterium]